MPLIIKETFFLNAEILPAIIVDPELFCLLDRLMMEDEIVRRLGEHVYARAIGPRTDLMHLGNVASLSRESLAHQFGESDAHTIEEVLTSFDLHAGFDTKAWLAYRQGLNSAERLQCHSEQYCRLLLEMLS